MFLSDAIFDEQERDYKHVRCDSGIIGGSALVVNLTRPIYTQDSGPFVKNIVSLAKENTNFRQEIKTANPGAGDGFHNAEGVAKLIQVGDGTNILRLENLKATNGPDLYVYLSADKTASDFVSLGRLKGNMGNQNYEIPTETHLTKYNNVLIWCRAFSVLFGSAQLL